MSGTLLGLVMGGSVSTKAQAEFGSVRVVFIKAGPLVGAGRGRGVLTFQGRNYPFKISSFGATIGNSTSTMVGQVLNIRAPEDIEGTYNFFQLSARASSNYKMLKVCFSSCTAKRAWNCRPALGVLRSQ